jgi:hypothetical protein
LKATALEDLSGAFHACSSAFSTIAGVGHRVGADAFALELVLGTSWIAVTVTVTVSITVAVSIAVTVTVTVTIAIAVAVAVAVAIIEDLGMRNANAAGLGQCQQHHRNPGRQSHRSCVGSSASILHGTEAGMAATRMSKQFSTRDVVNDQH